MELISGTIFIITILLLLFLLSMIWPPDSPWSPWWRTNNKTAHAICKTAKINEEDFIIDLGCGDGEVLLTAASKYKASGLGIEIDPFRAYYASLRIVLRGLSKKVEIKRANLFETNISKASVIVVYLVPKTLKRLEPIFKKQLRAGTRVVSYMYEIPYLPLKSKDTKNKVYVYEIPV